MTQTQTEPTKTGQTPSAQSISNGSAVPPTPNRASTEERKLAFRLAEHIDENGRYNDALKPVAMGYAIGAGVSEADARKAIDAKFANEFGTDMKEYLEAHREKRGLSNDGNGRSR